jgi:hypothetical protein
MICSDVLVACVLMFMTLWPQKPEAVHATMRTLAGT